MPCVSVRDLIGVPYKNHGRSKEEGFDCFGLDIEVFKRNGIIIPDVDYKNPEQYESVFLETRHRVKYKRLENPQELCIIVFMLNGEPKHTGVYLENGLFIHATMNKGVLVEPLHRWKNRVEGYYKFCIS